MNKDEHKPEAIQDRDTALVKAFQVGNKAAFDALVLKHKDKVFNLCYRLLGDYQEANDFAQETFVKVYKSLNKFRLESTFTTWVYRIAVNTCKNRIKSPQYRYGKKMVRIDNPQLTEDSTHSIELIDETQSPFVELEKKEKWMMIRKAIDSLPAEQKTVVVLRDIEGLSYEEIAGVTGYNLGTVKSKLARARFDLREKLRRVI
jgi:RNA polymerase sigma-70 factor (ECF subfamily)